MARDSKTGRFNTEGRFLMRLPMNREGERTLNSIKKYMNNDQYKLSIRYSGKRSNPKAYTTKREDATSMRVYLYPKTEDEKTKQLRESLRIAKISFEDERMLLEDKTNQVFRFKQALKGLMGED